jgi:VanZ family protein
MNVPQAAPRLHLALLWWVMGWGMVLFIAVSCLVPPRYVPNLHLWDKAEHALAFFGMTVWFGGLMRRGRYPWLALLMLLFGAGIEFAQGWMKLGREADIKDFLADAVGVAVALLLLWAGLWRWPRWIESLLGYSRERA